MKEQYYIKVLQEYQGMSVRAISKETGFHRDTIRKYLNKTDWSENPQPRKQKVSALDPLKEVIDKWLEEDVKRKPKFRRTAVKIYNDLACHEEYGKLLTVGRQTVSAYITKRKKELFADKKEVFMYISHSMGEAQVDFGEILETKISGVEEKLPMLVVSFPYSNAGFVQICRDETTASVCKGLISIFEHIGAVPPLMLFDNMTSAVSSIGKHGERTLTDLFMRLSLHYRFKPEFCNPSKGNEKGNVEKKVRYTRKNLLLPPPVINSLDDFNKQLLEKCDKDNNREHYRKKRLIFELFSEEKQVFEQLPEKKFRPVSYSRVKTDKYGLIQYENNKYSTSQYYPLTEVWLEVGVDELRILDDNYQNVITHKRSRAYAVEPFIDYSTYFDTITKRPKAFINSQLFISLPEIVKEHLKNLTAKELKTTLLFLLPILKAQRIGDIEAVLELSVIKTTDDLIAAHRALTEDPNESEAVTHPSVPEQPKYEPDLSEYRVLQGGA